jgi:hypothetical protein
MRNKSLFFSDTLLSCTLEELVELAKKNAPRAISAIYDLAMKNDQGAAAALEKLKEIAETGCKEAKKEAIGMFYRIAHSNVKALSEMVGQNWT